jgi:hypothetical protein
LAAVPVLQGALKTAPKAKPPMEVKEVDKTMLDRLVHRLKELEPIVLRLLGITMLERLLHR